MWLKIRTYGAFYRPRCRAIFGERHISSSRQFSAPKTTTVQRGNAFEERSLKLLEKTMSMALTRVGGKEDGGIDLLGWWWLPYDTPDASDTPLSSQPRRRIRIIGQCKAEKKKMGPNYVRELEGVLYRFLTMTTDKTAPPAFPLELSTYPLVALLISESVFTKSTILRAHSSPIPFILLHFPPVEDSPVEDSPAEDSPSEDLLKESNSRLSTAGNDTPEFGSLGYVLCNPALSGALGLLKGHVEVRWERHHLGGSGRPALWWKGKKLESQIPDIESVEVPNQDPQVA